MLRFLLPFHYAGRLVAYIAMKVKAALSSSWIKYVAGEVVSFLSLPWTGQVFEDIRYKILTPNGMVGVFLIPIVLSLEIICTLKHWPIWLSLLGILSCLWIVALAGRIWQELEESGGNDGN